MYGELLNTLKVTEDEVKLKFIENAVGKILLNQNAYKEIYNATGIPSFVIGVVHYRESNCNFTKHLHNGDPLTTRTVNVPAGRPTIGEPPFTWHFSALDALYKIWKPKQWDIVKQLEFLERYNGLGYRKKDINSPYLWSFTNHYTSGLFVADGKFNSKKEDARPGCVPILLKLYES